MMEGDGEVALKLPFPVLTPDGKTLLPADTLLEDGAIDELEAAGKETAWPEMPLLEYGTVRQDLQRYAGQGHYRVIFGEIAGMDGLKMLMGKVKIPIPALESIDYFKKNDFYTYRHILMVFALSCLLSRDLDADSRSLLMEATAGPLHDFGKICVPLPILKKSSPLRRSERRLLERHTEAGHYLLRYYMNDSEGISPRVARDHHERRDGSGYPRGIVLTDNMVEVVAACDIYDALVSPRPYRKGSYDNRTALEEITRIAEEGKVSWDVTRHLVALSRGDKPSPQRVDVSLEKRGTPPPDNNYGVLIED